MPVSCACFVSPIFSPYIFLVDIKELKLLGAFHHNNIVRFVSLIRYPEVKSNMPLSRSVSAYQRILKNPLS